MFLPFTPNSEQSPKFGAHSQLWFIEQRLAEPGFAKYVWLGGKLVYDRLNECEWGKAGAGWNNCLLNRTTFATLSHLFTQLLSNSIDQV